MAKLKLEELKNMTDQELDHTGINLKDEIFKLRTEQQLGRIEKPHRMKLARRNIARILTILRERNLGQRGKNDTR